MSMELKHDEISSFIRRQLENFEAENEAGGRGTIIQVGDGIARAQGLSKAMAGEMVEIDGIETVKALVLNLEGDNVGVALLAEASLVREGDTVRLTGRIASAPVGEAVLGRVLNGLGEPIDGGGPVDSAHTRPIEVKAPNLVMRQNVCEPLETGIKAIDTMIPIGRGQRELIIGDRKTGKTAIAIDTIINQRGKNVQCIYVAVGQKQSTVAQVHERLKKSGAMDYTCIIAANASDPAALQYLAPYVGATIGEYFMAAGGHALVVYDDLTKQAQAYRQLSLLLRRPPGREAFPGDVFYLHSRLLERAAKLSEKEGGGSLTALPIIETQAGDISAYIPTNVISITDGQIYLDTNLFNAGQRPAIDVGLSVSRVGGDAQIKATKQCAGPLRILLSQHRELAAFSQFASDLDAATQKQLVWGERMTRLLRQPQYTPYRIAATILVVYAGMNGYADQVEPGQMSRFEADLLQYAQAHGAALMDRIEAEKKIDDALMAELKDFLAAFVKQAAP